MNVFSVVPMSVEDTMALSKSLNLELSAERVVVVANVVAHIRSVVAKLDELPLDETCGPIFQYSMGEDR